MAGYSDAAEEREPEMKRLSLMALLVLLAGCATPGERIAQALRPAIEQLPDVIRAIQESQEGRPPLGGQGEQPPLTVVVNFNLDLADFWGVWRLFAVTTKTDVDVIIVPAPHTGRTTGRDGRSDYETMAEPDPE